mgnify:FL=1
MARGRPFIDLDDFLVRSALPRRIHEQLAIGDTFRCFGFDQRDALWRVIEFSTNRSATGGARELQLELGLPGDGGGGSAFEPLDDFQAIRADYSVFRLSTRGHPMTEIRRRNRKTLPQTDTAAARKLSHGRRFKISGLVIVRQRPPTAQGTVFATIEDELGLLDLVFRAPVFDEYRDLMAGHSLLVSEGIIQRDRDAVSLLVQKLFPVPDFV